MTNEQKYEKALRDILKSDLQVTANGNCRVGDPNCVIGTVHRIAMIALGELDELGRTKDFKR